MSIVKIGSDLYRSWLIACGCRFLTGVAGIPSLDGLQRHYRTLHILKGGLTGEVVILRKSRKSCILEV